MELKHLKKISHHESTRGAIVRQTTQLQGHLEDKAWGHDVTLRQWAELNQKIVNLAHVHYLQHERDALE